MGNVWTRLLLYKLDAFCYNRRSWALQDSKRASLQKATVFRQIPCKHI